VRSCQRSNELQVSDRSRETRRKVVSAYSAGWVPARTGTVNVSKGVAVVGTRGAKQECQSYRPRPVEDDHTDVPT
jgi:hypothetical protein